MKNHPSELRKEWFFYGRYELQMYYQPKIALSNGKIVGVEALLRYRNGDGTVSSPESLLREIENKGEESTLDWFVYCEVCRHIRYMCNKKAIFPVSINFSRTSIKAPRFVKMLVSAADQCEVPHNLVEIEVTEGIFEKNPSQMRQVLSQLMTEGFGVAIDDFGKGYSSLGFIKDVDFTTLKIDMEFLREFEKAEAQAVIECVIALGKRLNKQIVSEGVETKKQAEYLLARGCDTAQGYYFAKPMSLVALMKFVKTYDHRQWNPPKNSLRAIV